MDVSVIVSSISLFIAMASLVFAIIKWRNHLDLKRSDYLNKLVEQIRTDPIIKDVLYMFDYGDKWYTPNFHNCGELEIKVDKTLVLFSYICYLKQKKLISNEEFFFFEYEINSALKNDQVQKYLYNVLHYSNKRMESKPIFYYLIEYGKKTGLLEKKFFDEKSYESFCKYLNF